MKGEKYRVVYLLRAKPTVATDDDTIESAMAYLNSLKRQGLTAWVETKSGKFFPVKGAMRKPEHL